MKRLAKAIGIFCLAAAGVAFALGAMVLKFPQYPQLVTVGPQSPLVIANARVFTGTGTTALHGYDVFVEAGRIKRLQPAGAAHPKGAKVIEANGKTLLPGLIDFHTHPVNSPAPPWYRAVPDPEHNFEAYLFSGVTTIVSMGTDLDIVSDLARQLREREIPGPRLLYVGSPITRTGGHPQAAADALVPWPFGALLPDFSAEIDTPADAQRVVAQAVDQGATLVKLVLDDLPPGVPKLSTELVCEIVRAAHARNVKVAAHIGTAGDALTAAKCGVDVLNHGVHRGPLTNMQAETIAAAGVAQSPTLSVFERCAQFEAGAMTFGPLDRAVEDEELLAQFSSAEIGNADRSTFMKPWFEEVLASRQQQRENALTMFRAGVPIFVGTDSAILGNIAGASIHHEMRLLVDAGIPPAEVLLGATSKPAAFLYEQPEIGTIEEGKIADLLLVDGNPLRDIAATEQIVLVVQDGRVVERHGSR